MDKPIEKKKWTVKKIATYSAIGLFVLFTFYTFILSDQSRKLNVEKDRITISEVIHAPFEEYIPITGTIEPIQTFYLDLPDGGKVIEKFVKEGAMLNSADAILKLENPNLSLQLMNTQSSFMLAESQLRQASLTFEQNRLYKENQLLDLNVRLLSAKRNFEVAKSLYQKGLTAKNEFESTQEQYDYLLKSRDLMMVVLQKDSITNQQLLSQNQAIVENSKNYLRLVQSQMENLTVRAPIKGQLTALNAEIGQTVNAGFRLGQIDNIDSFKVRAEIDEHYIVRVREGQTGEYDFNGKIYTLVIKTVYPQVTGGRFYVDMLFTNEQPEGIRRGQTVHAKLQLGGLSDALLVESGGFYSTTGGQWIFVLDKSGSAAERRNIKIGRQNPQYYEVLEGLKAGEKVVTSSYDNYVDYEKLVIK